jgi:uncharacterized paraquat-inducible protein A
VPEESEIMPYATCPSCDENVQISAKLREGDFVRCQSCNEQLELVDTDPYELDWPYDEDDDDDDDDFDDDDE